MESLGAKNQSENRNTEMNFFFQLKEKTITFTSQETMKMNVLIKN